MLEEQTNGQMNGQATGHAPGKPGRKPVKRPFVESCPPDMPISEVIAKAAAAGIKLSRSYVSDLRNANKRSGKKSVAQVAERLTAPAAAAAPKKPPTLRPTEVEFVRLVAAIGLERAGEILENVRTKLTQITML